MLPLVKFQNFEITVLINFVNPQFGLGQNQSLKASDINEGMFRFGYHSVEFMAILSQAFVVKIS